MILPIEAKAFGGFGKVRGMLSFDGRALWLRWETADSLFGLIKSGPQELQLPLLSIADIRRGWGAFWLNPYVELQFSDFGLSTQVPGSQGAGVRLKVRFGDRVALRKLVDAVRYARSMQQHDALSAELRAAELPPPQPVLTQSPPVASELQPPRPRQLE